MSTLETHQQIKLFFKCFSLIDADTFSKSDPYIKVYLRELGNNANATSTQQSKKTFIGQTEVIKNNLNPVFVTGIEMNYFFEVRQQLDFEVFDKDRVGKDDFLGRASCSVADIISSKKSTRRLNLENEKNKGEIEITAQPLLSGTTLGVIEFQLVGQDFKKMKVFGKADPFFVLQRILPNGETKDVFRSEIIKKELNPAWKMTKPIEMIDLCGADAQKRCVRVSCYSGDKSTLIGQTEDLCANDLINASPSKVFEILFKDPKKKKNDKCTGTLKLAQVQFTPSVSFLEHLQAGMEINIAFSIDFTGSNGDWRRPNSLHFYDPARPNDYLQAMLAVSNVVQEYDTDRQFPAFGFGAITPFTRGTSHFFPLNGNPQNAYCNGMQAVIDCYAQLLPQLQFSGPTNFAPTIRNVCEGARASANVYTILMILTDGAITDMQDTVDAIVEADDAPLSIVIIGIGNADFGSMVRLDGDDEPLEHRNGRVTRRDLVQFVPFNEFRARGPQQLAAEVLYEIPRQVEVWGRLNNVHY